MIAGYLSRAPLARGSLAALALIAGCATVPPEKPVTAPAIAPSSLPAQYRQVAFDAVPGWSDDHLQDAWPAFRVGCKSLASAAASRALWMPVCTAADSVDPSDAPAIRAFFETHFSPYQVVAADGRLEGSVTGYRLRAGFCWNPATVALAGALAISAAVRAA